MSTFKGFLEEIPGIAIDRFEGQCLEAKFLFLSHCHADHMSGLSTRTEIKIPLITHEISAVFLKKQFPNLANSIEAIQTESPLYVSYRIDDQDYHLAVTALPANHCPGSVMFLFQTNLKTVLYTGDFRILRKDFPKYDILQNNVIDSLYLDSTFLAEKYKEFPTQSESVSSICSFIRAWLGIHKDNKILIEMPAQYGIEFLFAAIERKLKEKIHVKDVQWQKYAYLPAMDNCVSPDAGKCRIFTKFKGTCQSKTLGPHFRVIKVSALFWSHWQKGEPIVVQVHNKNEFRIAYSSHCSYSELEDFLKFTMPKKVSLNVVSNGSIGHCKTLLEKIYPSIKEEIVDHELIEKNEISFENIFLVSNPTNVRKSSVGVKFPPKRPKL